MTIVQVATAASVVRQIDATLEAVAAVVAVAVAVVVTVAVALTAGVTVAVVLTAISIPIMMMRKMISFTDFFNSMEDPEVANLNKIQMLKFFYLFVIAKSMFLLFKL